MTEFSCGRNPSDPAGHAGGSDFNLDCTQVIREVWTLLDGECKPEEVKRLLQHLEKCPECFEDFSLAKRIKALIGKKCRGDKAPEQLRKRLRLEISRTTIIRGQQPF